MGFKMHEQGRIALKGALASALAFLAFVMCLPQLAFAEEAYQTIDGVMTITMQSGGASGGADGGASSAIATSATGTSGASSSVLTGDTLIWLILGIVVLLAGAVYIIVKSRRLASVGAPAGASATGISADTSVNTTADSSAENLASAKRKTIIVAIVTALIACACFGMFASKSSAFAKDYLKGITGTSNIVVDEQGNVINNDLTIANNSGQAVFITNIQAPEELNGWNASIKDETVESGSSAKGTWDGKTIPASVLEQVKNNSSSRIKLALKINISKVLDFDTFSFDAEGLIYNGEQITPVVTSDTYKQGTDFEVAYGENKNAGEGTITIKGIGDYKGEKTYTFAIAPATLFVITPSAEKVYDGTALTSAGAILGFVNGETATFSTTGAQTDVGESSNTYTIDWNGTAKQANYNITEELGALKVTENTTAITVTVGDTSITYNGKVLTGDITVTGVPKGFTYEAKTSGSQQDVGTSKCSVAEFIILDANKNNVTKNFSNITKNEGTLTVNKRAVTLTSESATKTYDGTALTKPTVTGGDPSGDTGFVSGEVNNIKATGSVTNVSNGEVTNTITYETASTFKESNYTINKTEGKLSITPATLTVTTPSAEKVYDGTALTAPATADNLKGLVKSETATVKVSGTQTSVGSSKNTYDGIEWGTAQEGNYEVTSVTEGTLTVTNNTTKIDVTAGSAEKAYDGTALTSDKVDVSGLPEGFIYTTVTEGTQTDAGTGTNTVTEFKIFDPSGNDVTEYFEGIEKHTGTLKVTQREVTLTSATDSKTYDGTALTKNEVKLTAGSFVGSQSFSATTTGTITNVGSIKNTFDYELTNGAKADNYNVTVEEGTLSVSKAPLDKSLTLTTNAAEKTYDSKALEANEASATGLPEGNTVKIEYSTEGINWTEDPSDLYITNVSESTTVQVRATSSANYDGTVTTTAPLTITKRTVELTSESGSKVYDGTALTKPDVTGWQQSGNTGFLSNEVSNVRATGSVTNVSEGEVTNAIAYDTASNFKADNYTINKDEGALSVSTAPLAVTTGSKEKVYDNTPLTYDSASVEGLVHGERVDIHAIGTQTAVGSSTNTYTITWTGAQESNYTITKEDLGKLTVNQYTGQITVTVKGGTHTYDGTAHGAVVEVSTLPAGYTVQTAISSATATDVNGDGITANVDNLVIVNAQGEDVTKNLNINRVLGTIKITPATLTVTTPDATKDYDGTALTSAGTIEGFVNNETATFATTGSQTNVGKSTNTYSIDWDGTAKQGNYTVNENLGTLKVTESTIKVNVVAGSATKTYDGVALSSNKVLVTGLPEGFTYSTKTEGSQTDAGTSYNTVTEFKIFDPNGIDATECFANIKTNIGTLVVNKRSVALTSESATRVYDGTAFAKPDVTGWEQSDTDSTGFVTNEVTNVCATGSVTNVSEGEVTNTITYNTASSFNSDNYAITKNEGKLSITAQSIESGTPSYDGVSINEPENVTYDGSEHKWIPEVKDKKGNLLVAGEGKDYTLTYSTEDFTNVGDIIAVTITGIGNYAGAVIKTYQINQAKANYTLPEGLTVEEGHILADISLPTYTNGTLTWDDPSTSVGEVGSKNFSATFIPADTKNYTIDAVKISVTVNKKTLGFAVYSEKDNALYFYKDNQDNIDKAKNDGSYGNVTITKLYEGIETSETVQWEQYKSSIKYVEVKDEGVAPTSTTNWFSGCSNLTSADVSKLDTSKVTDMSFMFNECTNLTSVSGLSNWTVSNVENMANMFNDCSSLEDVGDITQWTTSRVTNMNSMFNSCSSLWSLGKKTVNWDTKYVETMDSTFYGCNELTADCSGWSIDNVKSHTDFNANTSNVIPPKFAEKKIAFAVYSGTDDSLTFYKDTKVPAVDDTYNQKNVTYVWKDIETTQYGANDEDGNPIMPGWVTSYARQIDSVKFEAEISPKSTAYWFKDCMYLTSVDLSNLDTSYTTDMSYMFACKYGNECLTTLDLSNLVTSKVTDMSYMFYQCKKLTAIEGLSNWNVSNVASMKGMFNGCLSLATVGNLGGWITSSLENTNQMFSECRALGSLDLSGFDTLRTTDMGQMFAQCSSLTSINGLSSWRTSKVTNMEEMFYKCSSLSSDCSEWAVDNVGDNHANFNIEALGVKSPWDLDATKITVDTSNQTWTGKQITPSVASNTYTLGTDYEVEYGTNIDPGQGTIIIKGKGLHGGCLEYTFTILPKGDISNAKITIEPAQTTYSGELVTAEITKVTLDGAEFPNTEWKIDTERSTLEATDAGTYFIYITGKGEHIGEAVSTWTIKPQSVDLGWPDLGLSETTFYYDGKPKEPEVKNLPSPYSDNYRVTYYNNVGYSDQWTIGWARVELLGNYTGSRDLSFVIWPR